MNKTLPVSAERWRPVVGWEGVYDVSNFGQVRRVVNRYGNPSGRLVKPTLHSDGGLQVSLAQCGTSKVAKVHRLVAEAFLAPDPSRPYVNHKDGCRFNNRAENLEWCTLAENNAHAAATGLTAKGTANAKAKVDDDDVRAIHRRRSNGESVTRIAEDFGISSHCVYDIATGETWKHLGLPPINWRDMRRAGAK